MPSQMEPGIDLLDPAANRLALDICELLAHISAASAELAAKAARFDESGGWGDGGIRSCAEFLSQEAGLDLHTGHDLLRVGRALNSLPKLAAACAAGELSYDKARAVATVATPEDEAIFVDLALQLTGSQPDGRCDLEGGHPLSRDAALRLGCDADVIAVTTRNGLPIDVGRTTRLIPHRLRTALATRDRGCRYPGCGIPARRTEGHHLEHWARGGATTLDNLLSFCRFHHGRHHKGDFAVTKVGPNEFRFTTRDGREIVPRHTRVDPDTGGGNRLRATAHSRGIPITPYTPAARDGSNLGWARASSTPSS